MHKIDFLSVSYVSFFFRCILGGAAGYMIYTL